MACSAIYRHCVPLARSCLHSFTNVNTGYNSLFSSGLFKGLSQRSPFIQTVAKCSQFIRVQGEVITPEKEATQKVLDKVNNLIENKTEGRLFAVVHLMGKQFKITENDIIIVEGSWPPTGGDQIRLEKVLLVGSKDFTLIGRPMLPLDQVNVTATIIEKSLTHTKTRFLFIKREKIRRIKFVKREVTYIRINSIELSQKLNDGGDTDGLKDRIF